MDVGEGVVHGTKLMLPQPRGGLTALRDELLLRKWPE